MFAWSRLLLFNVMPSGRCFRPAAAWVGVSARDVGVFARAVGIPVLDVLPFARDRFKVLGEFDRVDGGLGESAAVLNFLTERGSLEFDPGWLAVAEEELLEG